MKIELFTTCPPSHNTPPQDYLSLVTDVAGWSEAANAKGILVYTDNSLLDPWIVSQIIIQKSERLSPLVAVQPLYMHPYAAAKMVVTLSHLYQRHVHLNLLAGGFTGDRAVLEDRTAHDDRYARTKEYGQIVKALLNGNGPFTLKGEYYAVKNLTMTPALPTELIPQLMVSGSSDAGMAVAATLGATAIRYPQPGQLEEDGQSGTSNVTRGIRIGIIARESNAAAWSVARQRFPSDRKGQLKHALAMKVSDSHWHQQLSSATDASGAGDNPYWLGPFRNGQTYCPYLVGSYDVTAREISSYIAKGYRTVILDVPASFEDLEHAGIALHRAGGRVQG